jgi:uncharacterized coiled-coil DUF342 family protein
MGDIEKKVKLGKLIYENDIIDGITKLRDDLSECNNLLEIVTNQRDYLRKKLDEIREAVLSLPDVMYDKLDNHDFYENDIRKLKELAKEQVAFER